MNNTIDLHSFVFTDRGDNSLPFLYSAGRHVFQKIHENKITTHVIKSFCLMKVAVNSMVKLIPPDPEMKFQKHLLIEVRL